MQEAGNVSLGGAEAKPLRFDQLDVLLDQSLGHAGHHERGVGLGHTLALEHARRRHLDVGGRDVVNRRQEAAQRTPAADGRVGVGGGRLVEDAGHQGDDHGDAGDGDDRDKDELGEAVVFLQEANHG